jgi:hypothetical protein
LTGAELDRVTFGAHSLGERGDLLAQLRCASRVFARFGIGLAEALDEIERLRNLGGAGEERVRLFELRGALLRGRAQRLETALELR